MSRPRLAMVVANGITGDSRVIKSAVTASRLGFEVLLVGTGTGANAVETRLGDVRVVRVVGAPSGSAATGPLRRTDGVWEFRPLAPVAFRSSDDYARAAARRSARRATTRESIDRVKDVLRSGASRPRTLRSRIHLDVLRLRSLVLDGWFVVRRRAYVRPPIRIGSERPTDELAEFLRSELPFVSGFVEAAIPVLDKFSPDVVHAHDMYMGALGAAYASHTGRRGRRVPWVYDAHEWVAGLRDEHESAKTLAGDALEAMVIHDADAVVTVGDAVADVLVEGRKLTARPDVVLNAPPARADRHGGGLRAAFGLTADVPLLVYHGVVKPKRGIGTVVEALVELPEVHLALVADTSSPHVAELLNMARDLGVAERIHVHPYVAPDQISTFVADATAGIHPLTHSPNAEVAIPTKVFEYVQARLPLVVADTRAMSAFVREHGIGEVFVSGNPVSFTEAVTRLLERPERPDQELDTLAGQYTWERQEDVLASVWGRVLGRTFRVPAMPFSVPEESS